MKYLIAFCCTVLFFSHCKKNSIDDGDLTGIAFNPTSYTPNIPEFFPIWEFPPDNSPTKEGIELGRRLFYDPVLSADSTMSCSSCHLPEGSFSDNLEVSVGIDDLEGRRSSMSLLNVAFYQNGLFWDGRSDGLEEQALLPVTDPIELHNDWDNVVEKMKQDQVYPNLFRSAFGIENKSEISKELAAKALAQFQRTMISSGNSKYDKVLRGEVFYTDDELEGFDMFFDVSRDLPDAECGHCHNAPLFTTNEYFNNGIEEAANLQSFPDLGRGEVTENQLDNGKFRAPTLRNLLYTAPYMHDGRFKTLNEVLDHYNSGGHSSPNKDPLIYNLGLTPEQKDKIIAFLMTLTDEDFLYNQNLSSPFN